MLYWGLGVVLKTNDEIYVLISIGKYINLFICFLYCVKEDTVAKTIESEVAFW